MIVSTKIINFAPVGNGISRYINQKLYRRKHLFL